MKTTSSVRAVRKSASRPWCRRVSAPNWQTLRQSSYQVNLRGVVAVQRLGTKEQLASLAEQNDGEKLRSFAVQHVRRYLNNHMTVSVTWGYFEPIECNVTEFEAAGMNLLFANQFRLNSATNRFENVKIPSPPLGMTLIEVPAWRLKFATDVERLLQTNFRGFPEACLRGDYYRVAKDFLNPIFEYYAVATGRVSSLNMFIWPNH